MTKFVEIEKDSAAAMQAVDSIASTVRAVAILDALGFRARVASTPVRELARQYENAIATADDLNRRAQLDARRPPLIPDHPIGDPFCYRYIFSDSIILVALDDTSVSALKLLLYARWLLQGLLAKRLPMRGGVTAGELYHNPATRVTVGKALVEAYELEQRQEWLGASVSPSFWMHYADLAAQIENPDLPLSNLFSLYAVPVKGNLTENLRTLNWRFNLVASEGTRELLRNTGLDGHPLKFQNTLAYAASTRERGNLFAPEFVPPAECGVVTWIGPGRPPFDHGDDL